MPKSYESIMQALEQGKYATTYFLQGEEPFFINQVSEFIESNALDEGQKSLNQVVVYGKETELSTVLTHARRFPMMSEKQVVIVKEAQELKDINKESGQKLLESYIINPLPSTILVFCYKYKKIDKRKKLYKSIDNYAILLDTKKLYDNQIPDWILKFVKSKGHKITDKAVQLLSDNIGNNLERINNEVNKILSNFEETITINDELVQRYVGISKDYNTFELQKALAIKNILKANQIVNYFGQNPKSHPIVITLATIFSLFNKLLIIHQNKSKSDRELAAMLKINPYFLKEYIGAYKLYPLPKVIQNIYYIKEADLKSKGFMGNIPEREILKELIFKILH